MWDDISLFEKWAGQIFAKYFKRAAERNSDPAGGEAEILWPDWDAEQQFSRISWLTVSRTFPLNYSYVRVWVRRRGRERKAARRGALVERQHTQRVTLTKNYLHARKLCILRAATYSKPQIFVSANCHMTHRNFRLCILKGKSFTEHSGGFALNFHPQQAELQKHSHDAHILQTPTQAFCSQSPSTDRDSSWWRDTSAAVSFVSPEPQRILCNCFHRLSSRLYG